MADRASCYGSQSDQRTVSQQADENLRLKAIARQREWRHGGHRHLAIVAERIADETNQLEIVGLFSVAESLHFNFYNNWKPESMVRSNIADVKTLLSKLEKSEA